jgi:predicted RNA polymerase sigma factor
VSMSLSCRASKSVAKFESWVSRVTRRCLLENFESLRVDETERKCQEEKDRMKEQAKSETRKADGSEVEDAHSQARMGLALVAADPAITPSDTTKKGIHVNKKI